MADLNWSTVPGGGSSFDPAGDRLVFDGNETAGLGADSGSQLDFFAEEGPNSVFSFGGKDVTLLGVDPRSLHSGNVIFENGAKDSLFIYGDNKTGITKDDKGNIIIGGAGDDRLIGAGGSDSVSGGGGHDMLVVVGAGALGTGAYGNDTLNGGAGIDQVFYDGAELAINVNLTTGVATGGRAGASTLTLINIEQATTGAGNDTITGSKAANLLFGQEGDDVLLGGARNDTLIGGSDNDVMTGGTGDDVYFLSTNKDVVIEKAGQGTDTVFSLVNRVLGDHQENLTMIGSVDRTGTGNSLDNVIIGNGGNNTLHGESGNDTIDGKEGNDTIFGGSGNDSIDGGEGIDVMIGGSGNDTYRAIEVGDTVVEEVDDGIDTIITNRTITMASNVENLIWFNSGAGGTCTGNALDNVMSASGAGLNLTMDGGDGSDTVSFAGQDVAVEVNLNAGFATFINTLLSMENATGGNLDDDLRGDENANRLDGSAGADSMTGGDGNDTYFVDDAGDVVVETDNGEALLVLPGNSGQGLAADGFVDTVIAAVDYSLTNINFVENITLTGTARNATGNAEDNVITGNGKNNTLLGAGGADTLNGGNGNDVLDGGTGNDVLNGGNNNDTLVWGGIGDVHHGGNGADSIRLVSGNLNMRTFGSGVLISIEKVDLSFDGGANALTLTKADVLDMSSTDTLTVTGTSEDTISAAGFKFASTSSGVDRYTNGLATLLVSSDVGVET